MFPYTSFPLKQMFWKEFPIFCITSVGSINFKNQTSKSFLILQTVSPNSLFTFAEKIL